MRLLNTRTGRFELIDDPRNVRYAILSHVWARENEPYYPEPTYQHVRQLQDAQDRQNPSESVVPQLPEKIRRFCEIAAEHGYDLAWADTCCIDKTSSSELSEAINSMYDWYRYAAVCYVFLYDVPTVATDDELWANGGKFWNSKWHKRGWTLQELLAPSVVVFLSAEWRTLGTKHGLAGLIQSVTLIDCNVLTFQTPLEKVSVACRMSWAASRETTREEDQAYSLMGIFGVNMPTTYGEGRYAFIRLQEEILKHISDQTIFAWGSVLPQHDFSFHHPNTYRAESDLLAAFSVNTSSPDQFLLASSPKDFLYSSNLISIPWDEFMRSLGAPLDDRSTYTTTPYGVRTRLPLLTVKAKDKFVNAPTCVALLACKDGSGEFKALLLRSQPERPEMDYFVGAIVGKLGEVMRSTVDNVDPFSMAPAYSFSQRYYRTASLSPDDLTICTQRFQLADVYIPYRPSLASHSLQRDMPLHSALRSASSDLFDLHVSPWSQDILKLQGYRIAHHSGRDPFTVDVSNFSGETISIYVKRCDCHFGDKERFLNVTVTYSSRPASAGSPDVTIPVPHGRNHDNHVQSWTFRNGAASKEFHLPLATAGRVTVRLTLTRSAGRPHLYVLGIELWKSREIDIERERRRVKSIVTGQMEEGSRRGSAREETVATSSARPPLGRMRSNSHPSSAIPIEVSAPSSTESSTSTLHPLMHASYASELLTPPISRVTSANNGTEPEPWHSFSTRITASSATPSPVDPRVSNGSLPTSPLHTAPEPTVPAVSRLRIAPPRRAHTLNATNPGPSPNRPSHRGVDNEGGSHGRRFPRHAEQRRSLPAAIAPPMHGSSSWFGEAQSLRGSPPPDTNISQPQTTQHTQPPTPAQGAPGSSRNTTEKTDGNPRRPRNDKTTSTLNNARGRFDSKLLRKRRTERLRVGISRKAEKTIPARGDSEVPLVPSQPHAGPSTSNLHAAPAPSLPAAQGAETEARMVTRSRKRAAAFDNTHDTGVQSSAASSGPRADARSKGGRPAKKPRLM